MLRSRRVEVHPAPLFTLHLIQRGKAEDVARGVDVYVEYVGLGRHDIETPKLRRRIPRLIRRSAEGLTDEVAKRDAEDSKRKASPLIVAEGATVIDSSEMGIEDVVDAALQILKEKGAPSELLAKA